MQGIRVREYFRRRNSLTKQLHKAVWAIPLALYLLVYFILSPGLKKAYYPISTTGYPSRLLPLMLWYHRNLYHDAYKDGTSCGRLPDGHQLVKRSSVRFWQRVPLGGGSAHAYSAYWDPRGRPPEQGRVRILMYSPKTPLPIIYCQLWYYGSAVPLVVKAQPLYAWSNEDKPIHGANEPYIVTCDPVLATFANGSKSSTFDDRIPTLAGVSLVRRPCEQSVNVFNVQGAPVSDWVRRDLNLQKEMQVRVNDSIAVCVKIRNNLEDVSTQLAEWFEMIRRLDVDRVYVYMLEVHPNVMKIINHFEELGLLDVTPMMLPVMPAFHTSLSPSNQYKLAVKTLLMPDNDCLYRAIQKHSWITVLDTDEIIVPIADLTWPVLAKRGSLSRNDFDALTFQKYYFPLYEQKKREGELAYQNQQLVGPPGTVIMRHIWRTRNPSSEAILSRSLSNVQTVLACDNHQPIWCKTDIHNELRQGENIRPCHTRALDSNMGRVYQYNSCRNEDCDPSDVVKDDIMMQRYGSGIRAEILSHLIMAGVDTKRSTTPNMAPERDVIYH